MHSSGVLNAAIQKNPQKVPLQGGRSGLLKISNFLIILIILIAHISNFAKLENAIIRTRDKAYKKELFPGCLSRNKSLGGEHAV